MALLVVACGQGPEVAPQPSTPPARAVDSIEASDVLETTLDRAAPPRLLLEEAFEDPTLPGWDVVGSGRGTDGTVSVVPDETDPGRTRVSIGSGSAAAGTLPRLHRTVPARGSALYRLSAQVRPDALEPVGRDSLGASVEVLELSEPEGGAVLAHHGHLPRERGTRSTGRRLEYVFRTGSRTRGLTLSLVASHGPAAGRVYFDDVRLEELSDLQALASSEPYTSPTRERENPSLRNVQLGDDTRPSVLAPVRTVWRWSVAPEEGTLLQFAIGLALERAPPESICFSVTWGGSQELFRECIDPSTQAGRVWRDTRVDLSPLAGTEGELLFETSTGAKGGARGGLAVWGNPRILRRERGSGDERPNVVFLIFDTLRADHLGYAGYTDRPTSEHLDRLAAESIRFSRAYAPSAWTAPSLAGLVTSRYPAQCGGGLRVPREIEGSGHTPPSVHANTPSFYGIAAGEITLAQLLRAAGYETVGFHSNYSYFSAELGFARGFDRYQFYRGDSAEGAEIGTRMAREWLSQRRAAGIETPFHLMLHYIDPHIPYRMRRPYYDRFGPPLLPVGTAFDADAPFAVFPGWRKMRPQGAGAVERVVAMYDSEIAHADRAAAKLLGELAEDDDTIVVVLSDHGEGFGAHGHVTHGNSLYDELIRVPLLVRLPGGKGAGSVVDETVSLLDVAPTVLSLAGLEPWPAFEGRVLAGLTDDPSGADAADGVFAGYAYIGPDQTALIRDRHKYILTHPGGLLGFQDGPAAGRGNRGRRPGREELYDLEQDPLEIRDLHADRERITSEMREAVRGFIERTSYGLHVRCGGDGGGMPILLGIEADDAVAEIKPMGLEPDDDVRLEPSRRHVDFLLSPDDDASTGEDWIIVRWLGSEPQLTLTATSGAASVPIRIANASPAGGELDIAFGELPLSVPSTRPTTGGPWCQVWLVPNPHDAAAASGPALDEQTRRQLRALGYVD